MAAFQVNVNGLPRPVDGNGNVYASGTLSFYEAGSVATTINAYAEQALSTNLGPTITASGDGLFVDMWVNEDYRVVLKNAAGVIQWTRDVYSPAGSGSVDTAQLADGAVTLPKLLTLDSAKVIMGQPGGNAQVTLGQDVSVTNTGSVSVNSVQTDAVDTAGIQDDAVTTVKILNDAVNTAKVLDANITKAKLAANIATGMPVLLASGTPTAANTYNIDISSYTGTYKDIFIKARGIQADTASTLRCRVSVDGGSTFIATSSYYENVQGSTNTRIWWSLTNNGTGAKADYDLTGDYLFSGIGQADAVPGIEWTTTFYNNSNSGFISKGVGALNSDPQATDKVTDIQFIWETGGVAFNAVGTFEVYGIV